MTKTETITSPAAAETTSTRLLEALKRMTDLLESAVEGTSETEWALEKVRITEAKATIAEAEATAAKTTFLVIQEGGSSTEMYVHGFDTPEDADRYRFSCRDEGSYRTSEVIEVPELVAEHPDFWAVAEAIAGAATEVDYPDGDAPESDEDTDEGEEG